MEEGELVDPGHVVRQDERQCELHEREGDRQDDQPRERRHWCADTARRAAQRTDHREVPVGHGDGTDDEDAVPQEPGVEVPHTDQQQRTAHVDPHRQPRRAGEGADPAGVHARHDAPPQPPDVGRPGRHHQRGVECLGYLFGRRQDPVESGTAVPERQIPRHRREEQVSPHQRQHCRARPDEIRAGSIGRGGQRIHVKSSARRRRA